MPPGRLTTLTLRLTQADRQTLRAWQRSTTLPAGLATPARLAWWLGAHGPCVTR